MHTDCLNGDQNCTSEVNNSDDPFDNIDLLNLPSNFSNQYLGIGERNATGDDYHIRSTVVRERPSTHLNPSGDSSVAEYHQIRTKRQISNVSQGLLTNQRGHNKSLICIYDNKKENCSKDSVQSHLLTDEFLLPCYRKRENHQDTTTNFGATKRHDRNPTSVAFPFKQTSSGNLKVVREQVAYESEKFSVLIADPRNTTVSVRDKRKTSPRNPFHITNTCKNKIGGEKKMQNNTSDQRNTSPIGFMSNLLSSGIEHHIHAPIRREKDPVEYDGKQTAELLKPELNLARLGVQVDNDVNWNLLDLPEKKNLYLELHARITNFVNPDCKVFIDNEQFNCHLMVMQSYSEVFHAYVATNKVELPSDKCTPSAFSFIYEWMIKGDPSYLALNRENVLEIFNAAKYLQIKNLIEQCWTFIDNVDMFSESSAYLLYVDAKEKMLPEVTEWMLPRIQKFFLILVASQDWLYLDLEDVLSLLQSNYVYINCEMEIFMSGVRWLMHDPDNRNQYKNAVMSCVRFGNIAPWQLVDIKRNPDNPEILDLISDPDICKMIDDGLAYVIIKYWYGSENAAYQHWHNMLALKEPAVRNWSNNEKCYFTYREFLIYLDQNRRKQLMNKSFSIGGEFETRTITHKMTTIGSEECLHGNDGGGAGGSFSQAGCSKMPTMDEFLSNRNKSLGSHHYHHHRYHGHLRYSKDHAARIIQNAYRRYKLRSKVVGLSNRLVRKQHSAASMKRRDNSVIIRKFLDLSPKRPSSYQSDRHNFAGRGIWTKCEPDVMHVQVPREFDMRSRSSVTSKRKDLVNDLSLYYMEHESVLVFGGINVHQKYGVGLNTGKDIYRYLPMMNKWEFVGEMPAPRTHHATVFWDGRIYIVGGADPREEISKGVYLVVDTVWSFDPMKKIWFTEGSLMKERKNFGVVVVGKYLYAFGGQHKDKRVTNTVERYDLVSSVWTYAAAMKHPRMGFAVTQYDDKIWVGGGMSGSSTNALLDSVECYNPATNQWTEIKRLRIARAFGTFVSMSDNLYLIAGAVLTKNKHGTTVISTGSIDVWNEKTRKWEELTEMEVARHGHTIAHLGTQILIIGGVTTIYMRSLSSIECYCTSRGTWIRGMCTLPTCLSGHATVTLPPAMLMT